ncbi:MAG: recombinase RecA [Thermonemataceae bacterium]|nr:recombinase RecA [Thermonemataceae bacterium]
MAKKEKEKESSNEGKSKLEILKNTMEKIEKDYGKGSVMKLSDNKVVDVDVISTGSIGVDLALGIGGLPKGRIVEIFGPEASGKTTLAIHTIVQCQKAGGIAAFIDAEHAFDRTYAEKLGMNPENIVISQPDSGEQALEIAEQLIRSGAIDLVVIDSVAALVPKSEIDGDMGDSKMGLHARLMSQAMRKLTSIISKTNCCCVFINQLRDKIGVMFGSPETTTGGNALKYYASVRIDIRRMSSIKNGDDILGNRTKVKITKNKLAPPFKIVEFDIIYGKGISKVGEIIDLGVDLKIIKKAGANFYYNDTKLALGREKLVKALEDNPELADEIEKKIREMIASGASLTELSSEEKKKAKKEEEEAENEGNIEESAEGEE